MGVAPPDLALASAPSKRPTTDNRIRLQPSGSLRFCYTRHGGRSRVFHEHETMHLLA